MAAPSLPNYWINDPIGALVQQRFPMAFARVVSGFMAPLETNPELAEKANLYRLELEALPTEELAMRVSEVQEIEHERKQRELEILEGQRFFHEARAAVDVHHWSKMSYWTIDEAVALSFGKDPRVVTWSGVLGELPASPFARLFANRREILVRAKVAGQLRETTIPGVFLAWARRMQVPVPEVLVEAVEALGIQIKRIALSDVHKAEIQVLQSCSSESETAPLPPPAPVAPSEKPLGVRERDSLLKLVIGMAIKGYAYNPKAGRTGSGSEIAGDLQMLGIPLDQDTIRKYLNEGKALLPPTETD